MFPFSSTRNTLPTKLPTKCNCGLCFSRFVTDIVDREIFAVKNFSPVALAAKIKHAKISLW